MGDGRPSVWRQQIFHFVMVFRGKRPILGQILAGSLLEPNFGNLAASGPQLKRPSGTIGKRPVLGQILAGSLLGPDFGNLPASRSFWNAPGKLLANSRKPPCPCVKRAAAREHQGTSVFQRKIFPVERFEPETVFGHFELFFAFLKL